MSTKTKALAALPAMPSKNRGRNAAPQNCGCGCGALTQGGRFIPGHDARLLGWAIRIDRGFATDGTPVDCVRFADLGLLGERPDLIVSGINHGANLATFETIARRVFEQCNYIKQLDLFVHAVFFT